MRRINCCKLWLMQPVPHLGLEVIHVVLLMNSFGHIVETVANDASSNSGNAGKYWLNICLQVLPYFFCPMLNWSFTTEKWRIYSAHIGKKKIEMLSFLLLRGEKKYLLAFDMNIWYAWWLSSRPAEKLKGQIQLILVVWRTLQSQFD